jgi:hypothetical protein
MHIRKAARTFSVLPADTPHSYTDVLNILMLIYMDTLLMSSLILGIGVKLKVEHTHECMLAICITTC